MGSVEKKLSGKERLHALEKEDKYVFHGSPTSDIIEFELRQSRHVPDTNNPKEMVNDDDPAISATPYSDIAIFRSIINENNLPINLTTRFGVTNGNLEFYVSNHDTLDLVRNKIGTVYIFSKEGFNPYNRNGNANDRSMEWRSYVSIKPLFSVEVNFNDLPKF